MYDIHVDLVRIIIIQNSRYFHDKAKPTINAYDKQ